MPYHITRMFQRPHGVVTKLEKNSCHWLSHGDYTWRTPVLAVLNSSLLRESHCHPLVTCPIELITSQSLYPLFSGEIAA